jgi:hypothetical protein
VKVALRWLLLSLTTKVTDWVEVVPLAIPGTIPASTSIIVRDNARAGYSGGLSNLAFSCLLSYGSARAF